MKSTTIKIFNIVNGIFTLLYQFERYSNELEEQIEALPRRQEENKNRKYKMKPKW